MLRLAATGSNSHSGRKMSLMSIGSDYQYESPFISNKIPNMRRGCRMDAEWMRYGCGRHTEVVRFNNLRPVGLDPAGSDRIRQPRPLITSLENFNGFLERE